MLYFDKVFLTDLLHFNRWVYLKTDVSGVKVTEAAYIQCSHLTGTSTPQIDTRAETNTEYILWRPVDEVQVEVILEFWSVKHFERYTRYLANSLQQSGIILYF